MLVRIWQYENMKGCVFLQCLYSEHDQNSWILNILFMFYKKDQTFPCLKKVFNKKRFSLYLPPFLN